MKRKLFTLTLFAVFFSTFLAFSQDAKKAEDAYLEYFKLPRETLYLHTNKTTYLSQEDIWFKTYAFDRKNELTSKTTTNIYLGLYDSNGVQIDKKLYLGSNGAAVGNYTIDSLLPSGEYFLKVSTNWMKNFQEDDSYVQKIQIINPKLKGKNSKKISSKEYDFQFLPEGGHIVVDIKNNIGIKVINDEGKGSKCSGVILNSKNEEVARFRSNPLGIGKFSFTPTSGETYTAKVTLENSKEFEQSLPEIKQIGVGIMVNNLRNDKAIITLGMNEASWQQLKSQTFKLLLHKDGKVKPIPVVFDTNIKQIVIAKTDLYNGVNTITLFNDKNQPLLERLFFNHTDALRDFDFYLSQRLTDEDTIAVKLNTKIPLGENVLDASISVLPSETVSYDPDHTIVSAILLRPYLKGYIENPQYYFKDFSRKKQFELDVLLLTQGWSRYTWDRIFNLPPKPSFDFENGISVNGFVNSNTQKIESLFLYPTALNKSSFVNIDKNGKFNLKNFYPQVGEMVRFSYLDKKGKMKRPGMNLSYIKFMDQDAVDTQGYQSFLSFYQDKSEIPESFIIDESYEELDEITIKTDYKKKLREELRDPTLINGKVTKITKELALQYRNILDFIQNSGFDVVYGDGVIGRLGSVIITARTRGQEGTPVVFLDEIPVTNLDFLSTMTTDQVERIVIDRTGIGLGLNPNGNNFSGAIKIVTRKGILGINSVDAAKYNTTMYIHKSDFGFQPVKEFYMPNYASYRMQSFKDFGVIHWEPNIKVKGGISNEFKMVDTNLDDISFFIEGVSSDGKVFSQAIRLEKTNRP
jgi:hypothetical protein